MLVDIEIWLQVSVPRHAMCLFLLTSLHYRFAIKAQLVMVTQLAVVMGAQYLEASQKTIKL